MYSDISNICTDQHEIPILKQHIINIIVYCYFIIMSNEVKMQKV